MLTSIIALPQVDPSTAYPAMFANIESNSIVLAIDSRTCIVLVLPRDVRDASSMYVGAVLRDCASFDDPTTFWRRVPVGTAVTITQE